MVTSSVSLCTSDQWPRSSGWPSAATTSVDPHGLPVRDFRYEAADSGLLSPDLAAGIRRVKGPKNLGVRLGNWLTADQAKALWQVPDPSKASEIGPFSAFSWAAACGHFADGTSGRCANKRRVCSRP